MTDVFHGKTGDFHFCVTSEIPEITEWLRHDYAEAPGFPEGSLAIFVRRGPVNASRLSPPLRSPRSTWRPWGEKNRARFFGKVDADYHFQSRWACVGGEEPALVYEVLELMIAAFLGEAADERGLHRVHGLGVGLNGRGHLFLGASGAGKSRMAREFLDEPAVSIFSDDTPWLDREGRLHAYPHRLSFKSVEDTDGLPSRGHRRPVYGARFFVQPATVRWSEAAPLTSITLLRRGEQTALHDVSRWRVFGWLLRWMVMGLETPQIAELRLRTGFKSLISGFTALWSRLATAWSVSRTVPGHVLEYRAGQRASDLWVQSLQVDVKHGVHEVGVLVH